MTEEARESIVERLERAQRALTGASCINADQVACRQIAGFLVDRFEKTGRSASRLDVAKFLRVHAATVRRLEEYGVHGGFFTVTEVRSGKRSWFHYLPAAEFVRDQQKKKDDR